MLQSRLIVLLRNFGKPELKRFEAFLLSPYHNQSENMVRLFKLIEPHQPQFDSKKLEKEKLFAAMYGKKKYNDLSMRKLISELFKLAKSFIAFEELRNDRLEESELRYQWLVEHNIYKIAENELEDRSLLLNEQLQHNNSFYHHKWLHDLHQFELITGEFRDKEYKLLPEFDFYGPVHSLNRNYLINCIRAHHYLITITRIYNFSLNEELLTQVEMLARPYLNAGDKVLDMFFLIFQLARTDEEKYFYQMKDAFLANDPVVPRELMLDTSISLQNYCAKKIREGELHFAGDSMEIFRFDVEYSYFLRRGKMGHTFYFNVVVRGVDTNQLDWVDDFVENHNKYLEEDLREDAYHFAKAHVLFARKKFQDALRMALSCGITLPVHKIIARYLVARSQYELNMMDELHVELDSLRYHLKDKRINDERKQHLQAFSAVLRQLCELKLTYTAERQTNLQDRIEENKGLPYRKWFFEKMQELKEVHKTRNA